MGVLKRKPESSFKRERRLRLYKYLLHVKSKPCLVCGSPAVDPHHVTYAEPNGMGMKVGDQYVVPLCRGHHDELHHTAIPEKTWWALKGIDPLRWAAKSWRRWNEL